MRRSITLICCVLMMALPYIFGFTLLPNQLAQNYSFGQIVITQLDSSHFPNVVVQAIVRDPKGNPVPIQDLDNLELTEDKTPVQFTTQEVKAGVEVVVVLDLGGYINREGAVKKEAGDGTKNMTSLEEMVKVCDTFFSSMQSGDNAALITIKPDEKPQAEVVQGLTADSGLLSSEVRKFLSTPDTTLTSNIASGLENALSILENSRTKGFTLSQGIILVSTGASANFSDPRMEFVKSKAQMLGIPINSVLVHRYNTTWTSKGLINLSGNTNGWFFHYQGEGDLSKLLEWSDQQRTQYEFRYKSTSGTPDIRTVELHTKTTSTAQTSSRMNYQVNLLPPLVTITSPENAKTIAREAKAGESLENADPKTQTVQAQVVWQDNIPRVVKMARLQVEGDVPKEYILPYQSDTLQFKWDLSGYKDARTYQAILQVDIEDELGFKASSKAITVDIKNTQENGNIELSSESCTSSVGTAYWLCSAGVWLRSLNQYSGILSLGIALLALGLVIVFRGRISGAAVQLGDAVRETVARITKPQHTEVGAYLTVLRGAEDLPRNRFPIYLNTVTPIGRDRRQADLVFDENAEHSVVSRLHCEIIEEKGNFFIRDKGSTHGTYVNGRRLPELGSQPLQDGDQIEIGPVERGGILLKFETVEESQMQMPESEEDYADRETKPMMED
jgi:pSer/pThr/pTyr-binding forkhead associated (FHA) protein